MENLEWYRLFVRLIACSILVHDALYVCRDGKAYLVNCILPTFGLRLSAPGKLVVHAGLLLACLGLIWRPMEIYLYPTCLVMLTLKIASYSLRLANHMIFAWFILLLLCIGAFGGAQGMVTTGSVVFVIAGTQGLVLILYFFAFFHKLNREYFVMKKSCATAFVDFFCMDRGISRQGLVRFYRYFGVYGTVCIEVMIPILLCFEKTRLAGLVMGICFHFILALMGIVNFSMFMYTGLFAFLSPVEFDSALQSPSGTGAAWLVCACLMSLLTVWRWTPRKAAANCDYVYRKPAWIIQSGFALLTGCFLYAAMLAMKAPLSSLFWHGLDHHQHTILWLFFAVFFLNGLGPYLGYKTEFSFAMFSNLRLEPWGHLLIPASWRVFRRSQYIEVKKIEGLPGFDDVKGNRAAELAVFVLSKPREYYYSRYFFRYALRVLETAVSPAPAIFVAYVERNTYREAMDVHAGELGFCIPVNRFPFVMPRDPDARHSEQGSLVPEGAARQLF
ncbi:hypothetical protein ACFFJT_18290 [Dyella flava]|uniref:HTTM domain-containing protein n=1 Tax=Dyella flava TaxID=1920170 RepID=A0ABS2K2A5_9GAMM|nr:hypothetical protein [Dyella flava]MBM7124448.1 hypothetical protein [Dyella flava]GLQ51890.1 hypothetical protein GCM10010872_33390 [Dyella flava]